MTAAASGATSVACAAKPDTGLQRPERAGRTPAQQKIDSQLLFEIYRAQGIAAKKGVPPGPTGVRVDKERRAFVDIRAVPSAELLKTLSDVGATVTTTSARDRSIIAWVPLLKIEGLAETSSVGSIQPAPQAIR